MTWLEDGGKNNYINLAHVTRFELRSVADGYKVIAYLAGSAVMNMGVFIDRQSARFYITNIIEELDKV